jgi:CNP1-like family
LRAVLPWIAALALYACATLAAAQAVQYESEWEKEQKGREWQEAEFALPAVPAARNLIEFPVSAANNFKFFVDSQSISVVADGVVRYAMVARSPAGAETVSFEGIRCPSDSFRVYAFVSGEAWKRFDMEWRAIEPMGKVQRWHNVLRSDYFCPKGRAIETPAEGVDALRRGGHPSVMRY